MFVFVVLSVWQSVLFHGWPQNFQGQNRQVLELSDSEGQMNLLSMDGLTYALDATYVIWSVPLALISLN
jgi:hypothetical protein